MNMCICTKCALNKKKPSELVLIFILQFISNNLEQHMCKALMKCATVAQLNLFFKKSIDFYNIDIDMYILWYIHRKKKLFTDTHAVLYNSW